MTTQRLLRRLLATASMTTGLAIGLAANAHAGAYNDCVSQHPDRYGMETCCAFYGGTMEKVDGMVRCHFDDVSEAKSGVQSDRLGSMPDLTVTPGPTGPSKKAGLSRG
jgi:hypothetical protein